MLISLSKDYDFLKLIENYKEDAEFQLSEEQEKELNRRYENFIKNPRTGKPWIEVKNTLLA